MLAAVLPKVMKIGSAIKGAYEWFTFAEEAVSRMGLFKRVAAGAAAAAVLAAPVVATKAVVAKIEADKIVTAGFLSKPENEALYKKLLSECQNAPHADIAQCEQVSVAGQVIWKRAFFTGAKAKW